MKLTFWEAWKLWRNKAKTMDGHTITIFSLFALAVSGIIEGTFSFFTEKVWHWIWTRNKK